MIVKDLLALVEIEELTEIHMRRDHTADDRRYLTIDWLNTMLATMANCTPITPSDYALLGVMCGDNICRVFAVDMQFISKLRADNTLSDQFPRTPYLADLSWPEILGMEICRANITEMGIENFLDDVLRWLADDFNALEKLCINQETEKIIQEELSPKIQRAVMQHIHEHNYL